MAGKVDYAGVLETGGCYAKPPCINFKAKTKLGTQLSLSAIAEIKPEKFLSDLSNEKVFGFFPGGDVVFYKLSVLFADNKWLMKALPALKFEASIGYWGDITIDNVYPICADGLRWREIRILKLCWALKPGVKLKLEAKWLGLLKFYLEYNADNLADDYSEVGITFLEDMRLEGCIY